MSECSASGVQERKWAGNMIMLELKGALGSERLVMMRVKSSVAGHLQTPMPSKKIPTSPSQEYLYSSTDMAVVAVVAESTFPTLGEVATKTCKNVCWRGLSRARARSSTRNLFVFANS